MYSPGARDLLWTFRLLGKLADFNCTRIIPWTLVVNARVAVETMAWAVCSGRVCKSLHLGDTNCNANVRFKGNTIPSAVLEVS